MENSSQTTEQLILEAAEREFLLKGFSGARTTAIAEAAGVNHAMVHYYFRTKENLFEMVLARKMGLIHDTLVITPEEAKLPLFEQIRRVMERHFDFIAANPELPRFVIGEIVGNPERREMMLGRLREFAPNLIESLQTRLDKEARRGNCRRMDAAMLLFDIASLNIFPFMALPLAEALFDDRKEFIAARKREAVETILSRLRP